MRSLPSCTIPMSCKTALANEAASLSEIQYRSHFLAKPLTGSPGGLRLCHLLTSEQRQLLKLCIVVGFPDSEFLNGSPQTEVRNLRVMYFTLAKTFGIRLSHTAAYHPQANGAIER
ncbi:hypothetical protein AVEN_18408-1 [Araneus ventricosus]|uniref:Integrase catalytic domain-containing protein n=1 Tax=Araneus ventricosus TaxID=182803 RepID=A0A4Y2JYM7_ARAVE|nr:hypothetical protein AVEN_18408-1 [Araneus ventricosus]